MCRVPLAPLCTPFASPARHPARFVALAHDIRQLVTRLAGQGTTVFLTTHYMEEADQLCRRVAFLDQGHIVALDTPAHLKMASGERRLNVVLNDTSRIDLVLNQADDAQRLAQLLSQGRVLTVHSAEATLEEVFIELTGRRLTA